MAVNNSLVKKEASVMKYDVDGMEVKLSPAIIRKYIVNGNGAVTDQEVNYFMQLCKSRKLNPHIKEAYLVKYGNQPATMIVAKEVLERRAVKNKNYNGKKFGIYVKNTSGSLEKRENCIIMAEEELLGAWCEVYRKDWEYPAKSEVNIDEYIVRKKDGTANSMWTNKPVTMIVKVAKAQALREAFTEEIGGMYEQEEVEASKVETREVPAVDDAEVVYEESTPEPVVEEAKESDFGGF